MIDKYQVGQIICVIGIAIGIIQIVIAYIAGPVA